MPRSPVSLRVRHHRRGTRSGSPEERCDRLYLERSARTAGTCGPPSLGRSPGTHSTQAGRRTDSSPRLLRSSDRSAQPCPPPRPPEPDSSQLPPRQHIGGSVAEESGSGGLRSEEHTSELQSQSNLVCRLLLEKKKDRNARATGEN